MVQLCGVLLATLAADDLSLTELNILAPERNAFSRRALLVGSKDVQKLLGLSAEQVAKVEPLKAKAVADLEAGRMRLRGEARIDGGVFHLVFDENDRAVGSVLDPKQLKRLGQVQLQYLDPKWVYSVRAVARHLEVTDAQQREWRRRRQEDFEALEREQAGKEGMERMNVIADHARNHPLDPMAPLTEAQRKKYRELLGEPVDPIPFTPEFRDPRTLVRRRPPSPYQSVLGDATQPFRLLFVDGLLAELKVVDSQRRQLVELANRHRRECADLTQANALRIRVEAPRVRADWAQSFTKRVEQCEADLRRILDEPQRKRLREAWLQARDYAELFSSTETARELRVTDDQLYDFRSFMKSKKDTAARVRAKMEELLTTKQKAAFKRLQGTPLDDALVNDLRMTANPAFHDEYGVPRVGVGSEGP